MAEIINLNRWRKTKAKQEKDRQAETNRVAFGRTKAKKKSDAKQTEQAIAELDGKKLED